ncbi:MAG TPA: sulfotransferase [Streptosporangiaceae bacterium]|nr:sulfotransferase [Streptosporangiaceae bacterium]
MSVSNLRVLYVMGIYHSGTTVLSNLVGQLDGYFAVGELRTLWPKLTRTHYRCGCGELLQQCPVWSPILASACGEGEERVALARDMWRYQREALHEYHTWLRVGGVLRHRRKGLPPGGALSRYAEGMTRLYRAIASQTGAKVIVDSSKEPTDAAMLLLMPEISPAFVQIVRDPRGLVYSLLRVQAGGEPVAGSRWRQSAYAALSWSAGNLAGAAVRRAAGPGRSALLRYEDFVRQPQDSVAALADLAGRPARLAAQAGPTEPGTVTIGPTHTVGGNNNRFRTGPVQLREDTEWRSRLHRIDRAAVTTMCSPLMAHYGYRLAHYGYRPAR